MTIGPAARLAVPTGIQRKIDLRESSSTEFQLVDKEKRQKWLNAINRKDFDLSRKKLSPRKFLS